MRCVGQLFIPITHLLRLPQVQALIAAPDPIREVALLLGGTASHGCVGSLLQAQRCNPDRIGYSGYLDRLQVGGLHERSTKRNELCLSLPIGANTASHN